MKRAILALLMMLAGILPASASTYAYLGIQDEAAFFPYDTSPGPGFLKASIDIPSCSGACAAGTYLEGVGYTYFDFDFVSTEPVYPALSYHRASTDPGYDLGSLNYVTIDASGSIVQWLLNYHNGPTPYTGMFISTYSVTHHDQLYDEFHNSSFWHGFTGQWSLVETPQVVPIPSTLALFLLSLALLSFSYAAIKSRRPSDIAYFSTLMVMVARVWLPCLSNTQT